MSTWQKLGTSVAVTVTCLCWSLGHAEQLLFSCVSSKVIIYNYVTCHMSHVACHMGMCPSAPHTVARKVSIDLPERFYIIAPHMFICQKVFCRYARKILHNSPKACIHLPKISPNQIWSLAIMTLYYYRMMLPIQSGHSVCPVNLDNCLTSTRYHMSNK